MHLATKIGLLKQVRKSAKSVFMFVGFAWVALLNPHAAYAACVSSTSGLWSVGGNWAGCSTPGANGETVLCKRLILFQMCGALAYNGTAFSPADGDSQADAESAATADLPGSWIVGSACNNGGPAGKQSNYGQT